MKHFVGHHFESPRAVGSLTCHLGHHGTSLTRVPSAWVRSYSTRWVAILSRGRSTRRRRAYYPCHDQLAKLYWRPLTYLELFSPCPPSVATEVLSSPDLQVSGSRIMQRDDSHGGEPRSQQGDIPLPTPCQRNLVHDARPTTLACPLRLRTVAWIVSPYSMSI